MTVRANTANKMTNMGAIGERFPRENRMHPVRWVAPNAAALLDVGCNVGELLSYCQKLYPAMRLAGVDVNRAAVEVARSNLPGCEIHRASAEALPFKDASFDCVTCIEVLEHVPAVDRRQVLNEIRRVTRPGGRLVLRAPHRGLFSWLDPNNLRFRFKRSYGWMVGSGSRDKAFDNGSHGVVWHHHFTQAELMRLIGEGWQVRAERKGGLVLVPLLDLTCWPFYRMRTTHGRLFRTLRRLADFDLGKDYGLASYDVLLVLHRC